MYLYSTILVIQDLPVNYQVSREDHLLLFKPAPGSKCSVDTPIFWAKVHEGNWETINVKDDSLNRQAVEDIQRHQVEVK